MLAALAIPWRGAAVSLHLGGRRSVSRAPEELLRGNIAVVGGSAAGMQNPVVTPVDPMFPEVEIQATAIDNLLAGRFFLPPW